MKEKVYVVTYSPNAVDSTEEFQTKEEAIEAAWAYWNHLTRNEAKGVYGYRAITVEEVLKEWDEDLEAFNYDFYDEVLNIHYMDENEALEEVGKVYEKLNDFIKPSLDDIYKTMEHYKLGNWFYDDELYQDFIDDPEYYITAILEALSLIVEVPELKSRLKDLCAMHIID